jgi:hypothetical protein
MCQLIPNIRGLPISEPDPLIDAVIDCDTLYAAAFLARETSLC